MSRKIVLTIIEIYQKISSFWPKTCRFYPTCSSYTSEAIQKYGVRKGVFLGIKRIVKCHPFFPGGYDPLDKG
jgi:putative membrane protein insertion efficiency factor